MKKAVLSVLGVLSILYGLLILQVGSGTGFWMIWEAIGVFFLFWAFLVHTNFFAAHRKMKVIFHTMIGAGIAAVVILCGMILGDFSAKGSPNLDYMIVLGAQVREDGPSVILKYLLDNGIDEHRIVLEDKSTSTVENIQNSKMLMEEAYNGVGIVTNNFHVFRAVQIAKVQGLEGVCGISADSNVLYLPNNVLRECCGILKDWLMKNI